MLKSVGIENYRGIRTGRVSDLGNVNLFVGPNGSGKSTLLEAIFLGAGAQRTNNSAFFHDTRNVALVAARHNEPRFPSPDCWFKKDSSKPIRINYEFTSNSTFPLEIKDQSEATWLATPADLFPKYFPRMRLLDIQVLLDKNLEQRSWDQLLNVRGDRDLIRVMNQVYSLNLESFSYSAYNQSLKALFKNRDFALNIDDLGVGMRIAFRLFTSILLTRESAVLAEEFDGYQHFESLPRLVRAILELSEKSKSQLFLATHSLETVRAFLEEGKSYTGAKLRVFQTALSPDGQFATAGFSTDQAHELIEGGFDIRRTA